MTNRQLRGFGVLTLLVALAGVQSTASTLGVLFYRGGLEYIGARAGGTIGLVLLLTNVLDLAAYAGLLFVGIGLLRRRLGVRTTALVLAAYCTVMAVVEPTLAYWFVSRHDLREAAATGLPVPGLAIILAAHIGAVFLLLYGVLLFRAMQRWAPQPGARAGSPQSGAKDGRAATNAPRHWPTVTVDQWLPQMPFYNTLGVTTALAEGLKGRARLSLARQLLHDDGIVSVPLVIEEDGRRTAVFIYPQAGAEAAAHYSGARARLRQREVMNAVYYAPTPLLPTRPGEVAERLDTTHFSQPSEERPAAEYALWWPTPDDPRLADSPALAHLNAWFEALDGYAFLLFSSLAKALELTGEDDDAPQHRPLPLVALPVQPLMLPVDGPADLRLYLHASRDEGLWLAFDTERTGTADRNRLLGLLAVLATESRKIIDRSGKISANQDEAGRPLYFWQRARHEMLDRETDGATGLRLGSIVESGALRLRLAGVSTAHERQDGLARRGPSERLTDFLRQQLERGFEILARRAQETPAEDQESAPSPNLHPFVALRTGDDVHTVTLSHFTEPEAVAATSSVVADFGPAEVVALVCDGFQRVDDVRFDALVVRGQDAGDDASQVLCQRYELSGGRAATLGNWLLRGTEPSLLQPLPDKTLALPESAVEAYVRETLEELLAWVRVGDDDSGADVYEDGEPMVSPSLYSRISGKTHISRFMMGNLAWAEGAARETLAESPNTELAHPGFVTTIEPTRDGVAVALKR